MGVGSGSLFKGVECCGDLRDYLYEKLTSLIELYKGRTRELLQEYPLLPHLDGATQYIATSSPPSNPTQPPKLTTLKVSNARNRGFLGEILGQICKNRGILVGKY